MDDTEMVFEPAEWHANGKPCIVSIGNVADGFRFYGTFLNAEHAMQWASAEFATEPDESNSWDVLELLTPDPK